MNLHYLVAPDIIYDLMSVTVYVTVLQDLQ